MSTNGPCMIDLKICIVYFLFISNWDFQKAYANDVNLAPTHTFFVHSVFLIVWYLSEFKKKKESDNCTVT